MERISRSRLEGLQLSIREKMDQHPKVVGTTMAILTVIGLIAIIVELRGAIPLAPKSFFTDDNGKTWFRASARLHPPFQHDGRTAYRCYVYKTKQGKEFVGYLQKWPQAAIDLAKHDPSKPMPHMTSLPTGSLLKRPGDKQWTNATPTEFPYFSSQLRAPDGSKDLTFVEP